MADKTIGELPSIASVQDDSLIPVEQSSVASKMTGFQFKQFAQASVSQYADAAKESAESAKKDADRAEEYSGNPPIIQNNTWWVWNSETKEYKDTHEVALGNVMFATFEIDVDTGILTMTTPDGYTGPDFQILDGYLEVSINA